jgi:Putative addiction module component
MSRAADEVLRDARAALIDSLLDSLDTNVDPDAERLRETEILRRAREIDEGSVQLVPWSELGSQLDRGPDDR